MFQISKMYLLRSPAQIAGLKDRPLSPGSGKEGLGFAALFLQLSQNPHVSRWSLNHT